MEEQNGVSQSQPVPALPGVDGEAVRAGAWRPIADAPCDGTPIWAFLNYSGVRLVRWMNPAECATYEGAPDPSEYDGCWVELTDKDEEWRPKWWAPLDAIGVPPDAEKFRAAISKATGSSQ